MSNVLEGPPADEMKPGELYRIVDKGETRIGEKILELEKVEDTPGVCKVTVEVPENVYSILQDLAMFYDWSVERLVKHTINLELECELTGSGNLSGDVGKFLTQIHHYDPTAFRKDDP